MSDAASMDGTLGDDRSFLSIRLFKSCNDSIPPFPPDRQFGSCSSVESHSLMRSCPHQNELSLEFFLPIIGSSACDVEFLLVDGVLLARCVDGWLLCMAVSYALLFDGCVRHGWQSILLRSLHGGLSHRHIQKDFKRGNPLKPSRIHIILSRLNLKIMWPVFALVATSLACTMLRFLFDGDKPWYRKCRHGSAEWIHLWIWPLSNAPSLVGCFILTLAPLWWTFDTSDAGGQQSGTLVNHYVNLLLHPWSFSFWMSLVIIDILQWPPFPIIYTIKPPPPP